MRQALILFTIFGLFNSCDQSDKTRAVTDTATLTHQRDTTASKTERQILIEELNRLKTVFASNDKEKIADIFSFPLSNKTVGIYIDNSTFNSQYETNDNKTSRSMFIRFYQDFSESLQFDQINQLFKKINLDNLLQKDTLEYEVIIKTEPCYHFYGVKVEKKLVTLTVETNSNKNYNNKNVSGNEIQENDSSICEHVLWWVFRFDGTRLHFKGVSGAG